MNNVTDLRPIVNATRQAERAGLGQNVRRAIVRAVMREQRAGRSGNAIAGDIFNARLRGGDDTPPAA